MKHKGNPLTECICVPKRDDSDKNRILNVRENIENPPSSEKKNINIIFLFLSPFNTSRRISPFPFQHLHH